MILAVWIVANIVIGFLTVAQEWNWRTGNIRREANFIVSVMLNKKSGALTNDHVATLFQQTT